MTITKTRNETELTIALAGRLDTTTAPQLEAEVKDGLDGVTSLVFDVAELEYISSAGLRVLLSAQRIMNRQGSMKLLHVCDSVMEVFAVTGFDGMLTIE